MTEIKKNEREELYSSLENFLMKEINTEWNRSVLSFYEKQVVKLCEQATLEDVPYLIRIVQKLPEAKGWFVLPAWIVSYYVQIAMLAGNTIVELARNNPSRELLPALEALHSGIVKPNAPLEFIPIRIRLARALKHCNNLPIPASGPLSESQDLPRPTQNPLLNTERSDDSK